MDTIGFVTIRECPFPSNVRLVKRDGQIGGKSVESGRICARAVKIIVSSRIIRRVIKRITWQARHFPGTGIVDEILLREFGGRIVARGQWVTIGADLPDRLRVSM